MSIGFVYILLNPSFARHIKIGRTKDDPHKRARTLSRQTGVPDEFIVIYDELVSDAEEVEKRLHEQFAEYRLKRNKEFFFIPPKDAIKALQQVAGTFPVAVGIPALKSDLLEHLKANFGEFLDKSIIAVDLVQLPEVLYLEITRTSPKGKTVTKREPVPLWGLSTPKNPTAEILQFNLKLLKSLDPYDWIMISNLFPAETAQKIADEWERAGGKLEEERSKTI